MQDYSYTIASVGLGQSGSYMVIYEKNGWYANSTRAAGSRSQDAPR